MVTRACGTRSAAWSTELLATRGSVPESSAMSVTRASAQALGPSDMNSFNRPLLKHSTATSASKGPSNSPASAAAQQSNTRSPMATPTRGALLSSVKKTP
eukprot:Amastigsp_a682245_60.p5 type:complete len:100 gc:universal Amastigsp_a682245_60:395-96(-)